MDANFERAIDLAREALNDAFDVEKYDAAADLYATITGAAAVMHYGAHTDKEPLNMLTAALAVLMATVEEVCGLDAFNEGIDRVIAAHLEETRV